MTALDRRAFLRAACAGCAAVGVAACGGGSESAPLDAGDVSPAASGAAGGVIAPLADIPVGGSVAARAPSGPKLLLSRPTETTVVAFSAICTHQQCTVEPDAGKLACPCHGSVFDAFTGKNVSGPAPSPLRPFAVRISGADVVEA